MKLENIKNREAAERMWPEVTEKSTSVIELTNGEVLCNRFGKYQPNLCFVLNEDNISLGWEDADKNYNIDWDGDPVQLRGDFWVSKKGTRCFRPKEDGQHVLIRVDWGGCFNPTRGNEFNTVKDLALYAREASSNGGGSGYNFYVLPYGFRREVSLDEI
jgi:hypothetical protein